ncbi:MAG: hypothetical protein OXH50_17785 [Gemmatimonadetes bacterium]|nr:hypothetical protein [Gemmatimonadota bacterium]
MNDEKKQTGFSGISSLASDLQDVASGTTRGRSQVGKSSTEPQRENARTPPATPALKTNSAGTSLCEPEVVASGSLRSPNSMSIGGKWLWGLLGFGLLIFLFILIQGSRKPSGDHTPKDPDPIRIPSTNMPTAPQTSPTDMEFLKPPEGSDNLLFMAQIRWCLREEIRLEALRGLLKANPEIDRFNTIVSEYNRRCSSFRYRPGTLERAKREIEAVRADIVTATREESPALLGRRSWDP